MVSFLQGFIPGFIGGSVVGIMIMSLMSMTGIESERERKEEFQEFWNALDKKFK